MMEQIMRLQIEVGKIYSNRMYLEELRRSINTFYRAMIEAEDNEDHLLNLLEGKRHLEYCVGIIMSMIEPSDNPLIKEVNKYYDAHESIEKYFDNLMSTIDADIKEIKNKVEHQEIGIDNKYMTVAMKIFKEKMLDYMNGLIVYPLKRAVEKFTLKDINEGTAFFGSIELSKADLFEYELFREVGISSKVRGGQARQRISASSGMESAVFKDTTVMKGTKKGESSLGLPPLDDLNINEVDTTPFDDGLDDF